MRRLRRILANVLTAASLLLCVAAAGLWVRSYFVVDILEVSIPGHHWSAGAIPGHY